MNKFLLLFFISTITFSNISLAQSDFTKYFFMESNPDGFELNTNPKGYLMCSSIRYHLGMTDGFMFMQLDSLGNLSLMKSYSLGSVYLNSLLGGAISLIKNDGNYLFLFGSHPSTLIKESIRIFNTNNTGVLNWNKNISFVNDHYGVSGGLTDWRMNIKETNDGGYLIATNRSYINGMQMDTVSPLILRLNSIGDIVWSRGFRLSYPFGYKGFCQLKLNGEIILGYNFKPTGPTNYSINSFLTKMDSTGNIIWNKEINNLNGVNLAGFTNFNNNYVITAYDTLNTYLMEFDSSGSFIWAKKYYHNLNQVLRVIDVINTYDHGFVFLVCVRSPIPPAQSDDRHLLLVKADSVGSILWTRKFGYDENYYPIELKQESDSSLTFLTFVSPTYGYYFIKVNSNGLNSICQPDSESVVESTIMLTTTNVPIITFDSAMTSVPLYVNDSTSILPAFYDNCFTMGVQTHSIDEFVSIYPNPTSDHFTIKLSNEAHNSPFEIYNFLGIKIYSGTIIGNKKSMSHNFLPGIYFLKVSDTKNNSLMRRFVVSR